MRKMKCCDYGPWGCIHNTTYLSSSPNKLGLPRLLPRPRLKTRLFCPFLSYEENKVYGLSHFFKTWTNIIVNSLNFAGGFHNIFINHAVIRTACFLKIFVGYFSGSKIFFCKKTHFVYVISAAISRRKMVLFRSILFYCFHMNIW